METLNNDKMHAEYRVDQKQIFIRDLTDMNNEPAEYNKTVRGLKKAWDKIVASWSGDMTMADASKILTDSGIRMHYWCMVD